MYLKLFILIIASKFTFELQAETTVTNQNTPNPNKLYQRVLHNYLSNSDSAIILLNQCIDLSLKENDTAKAIKHLHEVAWFNTNNAKYIDAYKSLRYAFKLSEQSYDSINLSKTNMLLSTIYATFGQEQLSTEYMNKALSIYKLYAKNDSVIMGELTKCYYKAALNSRHLKNYDAAINYCDSASLYANLINQDTIHTSYFYTEKASLLIKKGKFEEAKKLLFQTKNVFESIPNDKLELQKYITYLAIIYVSLGDLYAELNQFQLSKEYFYRSLQQIDKHNSHHGMKPYIYSRLSFVYNKEGNPKDAYRFLNLSRQIYDSIFDLRSHQHLGLLEIHNALEEEIKIKNQEIYHHEKLLARQKNTMLRIKILVSFLVSIIIIGFLFMKIKTQQTRYKHDKEILTRENKLKHEAANNILETKNKELTTYTLQLIEKDKTIQTLIRFLKHSTNNDVIGFLKHLNSNHNMWEEFNYRFNSVNNGFYERLTTQFPDLSATEKKYCALIKLNFSGKEMAHLLGISENSVHISRHRLRKKMGLDRNINLSSFISGIR